MGQTIRFKSQGTAETPVELDADQKQLLLLPPEQSVAVLGAPGTGKTLSIIELVAHRVSQGMKPEEILVLTPNRRAATALRDRLALRINKATEGPLARTPISLAFAIAQQEAILSGTELPQMLTGSEQDAIIAELIDGHLAEGSGPIWPDPLVPEVRVRRAFRSELRDLFARCTEMGWSPQDLKQQGLSRKYPQWVAASDFWVEYLDVISDFRNAYFDSSELLAVATTALSRTEVLPKLKLLIIDDAQELTSGMVGMVRAFAQRSITIVVAGDPDTSATVFRGALPEFLGRFSSELGLPPSTPLVLTKVHRHGPTIRQQVQQFTTFSASEAGVQRQGESVVQDSVTSPVVCIEKLSRTSEIRAIASHLRTQHLLGNIPWSNMAVVVRNGSLVPQISKELAVAEVPTRTLLSERTLTDYSSAVDLISVIAVAMGKLEITAQTAQDLLRSPIVGLSMLEIRRLRMALRHEEIALGGNKTGEELLVEALRNYRDLLTLDLVPAKKAVRLGQTIEKLQKEISENASIEQLLWQVWSDSSLAATWSAEALGSGLIADEANKNLDGVMALFTSAKRYVERHPERPAEQFIAELLEADVPEDTLSPQSLSESVLVCTPSALIGAEFDVVAIAAVQENTWPHLKPRGSLLHAQDLSTEKVNEGIDFAAERKAALVDELRMFVLALSRAKQSIFISATANEDELPSVFYQKMSSSLQREEHAPTTVSIEESLSLRTLVGALRRDLTQDLRDGKRDSSTQARASALAKLAKAEVPGAHPSSWYGVLPLSTTEPLVDLADEKALVAVSPSKLETWETNQLAWFIQSIVGRTSTPATGIGSIIHKVMEHASEDGSDISVESLWEGVSQRWHELSFDAQWLSDAEQIRAKKMVEALHQYLDDFQKDGKKLLASEGGFDMVIGNANVKGFIDRIEQDSAGRVVIVDLKTGKYAPANKDIPENAQLACYQLAVAEGEIEGIPQGAQPGGAKLIYVTNGVYGKLYKEFIQEEYDEVELASIRQRIISASEGMAGSTFIAPVVTNFEKGDPYSRYEFRIHTISAVSSS